MERCLSCGFVYASLPRAQVPGRLVELGDRYHERLTDPGPGGPQAWHHRVARGRWTALEYAGHVADVFEVQHQRLALALVETTPVVASMDPERRVVEGRYDRQDPAALAARLTDAAGSLATAFARLTPDQWTRTAVYNWPETAVRTMEWLARHTVHEGVHHLVDIDEALAAGG